MHLGHPAASQNHIAPIRVHPATLTPRFPSHHRGSYCRPGFTPSEKLQLHPNRSSEAAKRNDTGCVLQSDKVNAVGVTAPPFLTDGRAGEKSPSAALFSHVSHVSAVYVKTDDWLSFRSISRSVKDSVVTVTWKLIWVEVWLHTVQWYNFMQPLPVIKQKQIS